MEEQKSRKRGSRVVKEVREAVERKRAICMERQEVVKRNNKWRGETSDEKNEKGWDQNIVPHLVPWRWLQAEWSSHFQSQQFPKYRLQRSNWRWKTASSRLASLPDFESGAAKGDSGDTRPGEKLPGNVRKMRLFALKSFSGQERAKSLDATTHLCKRLSLHPSIPN